MVSTITLIQVALNNAPQITKRRNLI